MKPKKSHWALTRNTEGDRFTVGKVYFGIIRNGFFSTDNDCFEKSVCHLKEFETEETNNANDRT